VVGIGPHPQWADPDKIVSLDPWGHMPGSRWAPIAARISGRFNRALVTAMVGRMSVPVPIASRIAGRALNPLARPDLTNTHPVVGIGPHPQWADPDKICRPPDGCW
jgi:hypothetical protein